VASGVPRDLKRRLILSAVMLAAILAVGTAVYRVIGGAGTSLIDAFYMTFITIATIGYGEIVDLAHSPIGRVFTVLVSVAGIGTLTYLIMTLTAMFVEGHLNEVFRRRRMEKHIGDYRDHFIVCGVDGAGLHVVNELQSTRRKVVVVDSDRARIDKVRERHVDLMFIEGDPTDDDTLLRAGLERAQGVFATTGDDNQNLVIAFTARQLNPEARVVVSCSDLRNTDKMKKVGVDAVVSPTYIGGLRMASEMIRPTVVSFLDVMMSRREEPLRVEEVTVPEGFAARPLSELQLTEYRQLLLLAVRREDEWVYNPPRDSVVGPGEKLVIMTTPDERQQLERALQSAV